MKAVVQSNSKQRVRFGIWFAIVPTTWKSLELAWSLCVRSDTPNPVRHLREAEGRKAQGANGQRLRGTDGRVPPLGQAAASDSAQRSNQQGVVGPDQVVAPARMASDLAVGP